MSHTAGLVFHNYAYNAKTSPTRQLIYDLFLRSLTAGVKTHCRKKYEAIVEFGYSSARICYSGKNISLHVFFADIAVGVRAIVAYVMGLNVFGAEYLYFNFFRIGTELSLPL